MHFDYMNMEKIKRLIYQVLKAFKLYKSDKQVNTIYQIILFGFVGLSNLAVFYVVYMFVLFVLQMIKANLYDYIVGNIIAWLVSVFWSFILNRTMVFKKDSEKTVKPEKFISALLKCYASYAFTGLCLNNILSVLWIDVLLLSKLFAPIINTIISFPVNFVLNKFWVFKSA